MDVKLVSLARLMKVEIVGEKGSQIHLSVIFVGLSILEGVGEIDSPGEGSTC